MEKKPRLVKVLQIDKIVNQFFVDIKIADITNNSLLYKSGPNHYYKYGVLVSFQYF